MNKIFRVIWNHSTGSWMVTSELAKGHSKKSSTNHVTSPTMIAGALFALGLTGFSGVSEAAVAIGENNAAGDAYSSTASGVFNRTYVATPESSTASSNSLAGVTALYNSGYEYQVAANATILSAFVPGISGLSYTGTLNYETGVIGSGQGNLSYRDPSQYPTTATTHFVNYGGGVTYSGTAIGIGRSANTISSGYKPLNSAGGVANIAIGDHSRAVGGLGLSLGHYAQSWLIGSTGIGTASLAQGFNSVAMGRQSAADGDFASAIGYTAYADGNNSMALGKSATAVGVSSFAIGSTNTVTTKYDSSTNNTEVQGDNSLAIGSLSNITGDSSNLLGVNSTIAGHNSLAIGTFANVSNAAGDANQSSAIGANATIGGKQSTAIGTNATVNKDEGTAIGKDALAEDNKNTAFGTESHAKGEKATSVGTASDALQAQSAALGAGAQADGVQAIAVGAQALANQSHAAAFGAETLAIGENSTSIGHLTNASGKNATAIGEQAKASGENSVAIAENSSATQKGSMALGIDAKATNQDALAFGYQSNATQRTATAIGANTNATGNHSIAISPNATAKAEDAFAVGFNSTATNVSGVALGSDAFSGTENSIALGTNSCVSSATGSEGSFALGFGAYAQDQAVVIGGNGKVLGALSTNPNGVSIGGNNQIADTSTAVGVNSTVIGTAIGVGSNNSVNANSIAVGGNDNVTGLTATVVGSNNTVPTTNTIVLGNDITDTRADSVYLGNSSKTAGSHAIGTVSNITVDGYTYNASKFAGNDPYLAKNFVTVGSQGNERKLIGVAAAELSETSTEAVNGSQLYALADRIEKGWNVQHNGTHIANVGLQDTLRFQGHDNIKANVTYNALTGITSVSYESTGEPLTLNSSNANMTVAPVSAAAGAGVVNTDVLQRVIDSIGWQLNENGARRDIIQNSNIINFVDGAKTSVNITASDPDPLKAKSSNVKIDIAGANLTTTNNKAVVAPGNSTTDYVYAGNLAQTINNLAFNATISRDTADFVDGAGKFAERINAGDTMTFSSGKNMNVSQTATANGTNVTFDLSQNVTFTNVNSTESVTVNGTKLSSGANGLTVTNATNGAPVKITNVADGDVTASSTDVINGSQLYNATANSTWALRYSNNSQSAQVIGNVARNQGQSVTINGVGAIQVTKNAATANGVNITLKTEAVSAPNGKVQGTGASGAAADPNALVTTRDFINAVNNLGWNATVNAVNGGTQTGKSVATVAAANEVKLQAGKNMAIVQNGKTLTYATADNVTFNTTNSTSVVIGDPTNASNSTKLTSGSNGLDIAGKKITNVGAGVNGTDAINYGQLTGSSWTLRTATSDNKELGKAAIVRDVNSPNNTVTITAGKYITLKQEGNKVVVSRENLDKAINALIPENLTVTNGTVATPNKDKVVTAATVANALNNVGWTLQENGVTQDPVVKSGDVVNFINTNLTTVKITPNTETNTNKVEVSINNTNLSVNPDGTAKAPDATNASRFVNAGNLADTLNNVSFNLTIGEDNQAITANPQGKTDAKVKSGNTVTFKSGENLVVKQEGSKITYAMKDNVTFDKVTSGNVTVGNATDPAQSTTLTSKGNGLDVGNDAVTGVKGSGKLDGSVNEAGKPLVKVGSDYYNVDDVVDGKPIAGAVVQKPATVNNAYNGLTDLANTNSSNVATIGDAKDLAWVVSDEHGYSDSVRHTNEVKFVGSGVANVVGTTTANGVRQISFGVNSGVMNTTNGAANVVKEGIATTRNVMDTINNSGWQIRQNGTSTGDGLVNPGDVVNFVDGKNTIATVVEENGVRTIKYSVADSTKLNVNNQGSVDAPDATNGTKLVNAGDLANTLNNISYSSTIGRDENVVDQQGKQNQQVKAGNVVSLNSGKGMKVKQDVTDNGTSFTYATEDNANFNQMNATKVTLGDVNDPAAPKTTITSTNEGLDIGGRNLVNVLAPTTTYTGALDKNGKPLTKVGDNYYAPDQFENGQLKANAVVTPASDIVTDSKLADAYNGITNLDSAAPKDVATVQDLKNTGWVVSSSDTNYADDMKTANRVNVVSDNTGMTVSGNTTANGVRTVTVGIDSSDVVMPNSKTYVYYETSDSAGVAVKKIGAEYYKESDIDPIKGLPIANATALTSEQVANVVDTSGQKDGFVKGESVANTIQSTGWTISKATKQELANTTYDNTKVETVNNNDNVRYTDDGVMLVGIGTAKKAIDATGAIQTTTIVKIGVNKTELFVDDDGSIFDPGNPKGLVNATVISDAINSSKLNSTSWKLTTNAVDGGESVNKTTQTVKSGSTVKAQAGKNMKVTQVGKEITYATLDNVTFNTMKAKDVFADNVTTTNMGVTDGGSLEMGSNVNVDMGNNQIHGVAPGTADTDAVNVSQLNGVNKQINTSIDNLNKRIDDVNKDAKASIAGAYASSLLPQVFIPGKNLAGVAVGNYKGESAVAVGYSRASDNGKFIYRVSGAYNTANDVGVNTSVGYQW